VTTITSRAFYMIRRGFIVAVFTTLIGLILPGLTAYKVGIFDEESMSKTMAAKLPPEEQRDIEHYRATKAAAKEKIKEIDSIFASNQILSNDQVSSLNAQLSIAHRLVTADPPVTFLPFYLSSGMLTWVFTLTPLAWLALVFYPGISPFEQLKIGKVFACALLGYISYQWTVWMRYFVLQNNGRKVIGFANYDVSHATFWFQEFHTILFWTLMSMVAFQWLAVADFNSRKSRVAGETLSQMTSDLSKAFLQWQLTSLLLALSYFPFTTFYWNLIVTFHDLRFLTAAIILHTMWLIIWAIISTPLFQSWKRWQEFKINAFEDILGGKTDGASLETLNAAEPIGDWAKAISASLTALSFLGPLLKAIFSK
jgi:hypothetical protein